MDIQGGGQHLLDDILYSHFGYNWDGMSPYSPRWPIPMSLPPWIHTQKTLTDIMSDIHPVQQGAISNFVDYLVHGQPVPPALWDLGSTNPSPLHENLNTKLTVNIRSFNNATYYFIHSTSPSPNDPSWDLVVQDPVTALECMQCDLGPSVIDVARGFLLAGKPFST
jgi:hypothetical protein